jgi:hypothetical protein
MGKGDRRGKSTPAKLPELAPVAASRHKQHRDRGRFARPAEDPRATALAARCHQMGKTPTREERAAAAHPAAGSPLGMVALHVHGQREAAKLWGVWQAFGIAERAYRVRILGMTGTPANAAISMLPERVEVEESLSPDLREPPEKDADAVRAWMHWRGLIGQLDAVDSLLLHAAERGNGPELWRDGKPTTVGLATCAALVRLADVVER